MKQPKTEMLQRPDRANFEKRIWVYKLKNEGKSNNEVAQEHYKKYGEFISPQAISKQWHRVRFYTLDELKEQRDDYEN